MPKAEFNERTFEYCIGYELQRRFGAYLIGGLPILPSQVEEASKGYDSAYCLHSGKSLFLQYKVSYFASKPWSAGAATFHLWGQPYFRARLHRHPKCAYEQHNLLVDRANGADLACYCAPCFWNTADLVTLFDTGNPGSPGVLSKTMFAPLSNVPKIYDSAAHSISYPESGASFRLHSQPSEKFEAYSWDQMLELASSVEFVDRYFEQILHRIEEALDRHEVTMPPPQNKGEEPSGPLARLGRILDEHLGAVLVLIPD